jgi:hypothetical protein
MALARVAEVPLTIIAIAALARFTVGPAGGTTPVT